MMARLFRGVRRLRTEWGSALRLTTLRLQFPGFRATRGTRIGAGCEVYLGRDSTLTLDRCIVGRDVTLITAPGARMTISADVIGRGSVVVAREAVTIGRGTQIAEYVTVRDANHDRQQPFSSGHFVSSPVLIGEEAWVGAKSTILAGVTVGNGATVAAGGVVTRNVAAGATVGGVPARPLDITS